jgi:hypothetical protein
MPFTANVYSLPLFVNKVNRLTLLFSLTTIRLEYRQPDRRSATLLAALNGGHMTAAAIGARDVVKKKKAGEPAVPKRYGTLIRVSDRFAKAIKEASSFDQSSIAEYIDAHLLPIVEKKFADAVVKRAKRIEGRD